MKTLISTLIALAVVPAAFAAEMKPMQGMPMDHQGMDHGSMHQEQTAMAASATGTVKKVSADKGTLTIAHGPVAELQWPAMIMPFQATPEQIASVQAGDKIQFTFVGEGMKHRIVSLEKQ